MFFLLRAILVGRGAHGAERAPPAPAMARTAIVSVMTAFCAKGDIAVALNSRN
jgi:hypothetical protein